jgi:HEAT repeat protein
VAGLCLLASSVPPEAAGHDPVRKDETLAEYVEALQDPKPEVRAKAVFELGMIRGPEARQAVPPLIQALKDTDASVRSNACRALIHFSKDAEQSVPALRGLIKDENAEVRVFAIQTIRWLDSSAPGLLPVLIEASQDRKPLTRAYAAHTLGLFGEAAAVAALLENLKDDNQQVRSTAARSLGEIGPEAKDAVPALIAALKEQDPTFTE